MTPPLNSYLLCPAGPPSLALCQGDVSQQLSQDLESPEGFAELPVERFGGNPLGGDAGVPLECPQNG